MSAHHILNAIRAVVVRRSFYLFLALFSSYFVFLLRMLAHQTLFFGSWTFYHLLQAQHFLDALDTGTVTPFHFALYLAMYFHGEQWFLFLVPPLSGVLSLYLFSLILPRYTPPFVYRLSLLLFLFSPFYLAFTTTLHPFLFSLPLFLLLFYLVQKEHFFVPFIAALLASFGLLESLLVFFVVSFFYFQKKRTMKTTFSLTVFLLLFYHVSYFFLFGYPMVYFSLAYPHALPLHLPAMFQGIGIFSLLLAFLGNIYLFREQRRHSLLFFLLFFLSLLALFFSHILFLYLLPLLFYLLANGFYWLFHQRWHFQEMKQLTIFILFLGIFFGWLAFLNAVPHFPPLQEQVTAYHFLAEKPQGVVYAPPKEGFFIAWYGHQEPFCTLASCNETIFKNITTLQDLRLSLKLLNSLKITYLVLPDRFIEQQFGKEKKGLLFILQHEYYFSKIYENPFLTIYALK